MTNSRPVISLLTDFGTSDGYVAQLKAVIERESPGTLVIDVSHEVPPQSIGTAAFLIETTWRSFPAGSIHVVVVDPGVGSARRAVAFSYGGHFFVGPDNGVFSTVVDRDGRPKTEVIELDPRHRSGEASSTFHGRDWFAPVAASIARGEAITKWGERSEGLAPRPEALRVVEGDGPEVSVPIVHIDRFGNAITALRRGDYTSVECPNGLELTVVDHYAEVTEGAPLALIGSTGYLELAVRNGDAATQLDLGIGDVVRVRREQIPR